MNYESEVNGVSIIVPAYNEQEAVGDVIVQLLDIMSISEIPNEIIVVDDGSTDNTEGVVSQFPVRLIRHSGNKGYGAALKTGIRQSEFDAICITDADSTYPNDRIPQIVENLYASKFDMIVGARIGKKVIIPLARRPAKWAIGILANYVAGEEIPDINSGLRVFRRSAVMRFFSILPDGFSFTTTITLGFITNSYLVSYMPINYHSRIGKSKIKPVRDTLNFIQLVLRIALYFSPLKVFLPLSGLLILMGVAWGLLSTIIFGRPADVSTLVFVMASVQVVVLGLLAELINRRMPGYNQDQE